MRGFSRNTDLKYGIDDVRGVNTSNMMSPEQQFEFIRNDVKSQEHTRILTVRIQLGI
jgi:hypothetical protein